MEGSRDLTQRLPSNPPDIVAESTLAELTHAPSDPALPSEPLPPSTPPVSTQPQPQPLTLPVIPLITHLTQNPTPPLDPPEDQNQNKLKPLHITIDPNPTPPSPDFIYENQLKFVPSSRKDLELMKNLRKVYISRVEGPCAYKVTSERGDSVLETVQGETSPSFYSRYFRQQQKVILIKDKEQHGLLKLDFGRSRSVSCFQTLRFAALTAHFQTKQEEPLCIVFKDRGCCVYSCCSSGVTYDAVPQQQESVHPFTVKTKRQWRNRAEFMVKCGDGTILAFIDKEKTFYTLTMGEGLRPTMKTVLVGFVIAMDIMDREDSGKLNCYLRPSTYVTIMFLLMLFFMIGAFLFHFITAMVLAWPKTGRGLGCSDAVHVDNDDPFLPPSNGSHGGRYNYSGTGSQTVNNYNFTSSAQDIYY